MNSSTNRNIIQVWNADHTKLIKTILAIPSYRMNPTGETVVRFDERPTGSPEAVKTWYYPGTNSDRSLSIARLARHSSQRNVGACTYCA
jgi:hypothetical protein